MNIFPVHRKPWFWNGLLIVAMRSPVKLTLLVMDVRIAVLGGAMSVSHYFIVQFH